LNNKTSEYPNAAVKVYHGYGHTHNLIVFGHILKNKLFLQRHYTRNIFINILNLLKLFFITPLPSARVRLHWQNQTFYSTTERDGFFKFEWESDNEIEAGWHNVIVDLLNTNGETIAKGEGKIFVPHSTQYGFISDIDDTVLISHSGTTGKKLWSMLTKNARRRKTFADVVNHYQLLSTAHTEASVPNPFFYVSSSEWNLYDYLNEFFKFNELPKGAFLLSDIKKWFQLFKTGSTKHHGKLIRVARILKAFPAQQFVLLGDNSQQDPDIYKSIADKYPGRIFAIYIRNISSEKEATTKNLLSSLYDKSIHTLLYKHTSEAIMHSKSIGLIV
jgi:phosphatidate phosphatase APP1